MKMNQKLSDLNRGELDKVLQSEMNDLTNRFAGGEISSHQARIFFYDQIRDSISIEREMFYREAMEKQITEAILQGVKNPSDNDIEQGMTLICSGSRFGVVEMMRAHSRFELVLRSLPEDKKEEWRNTFKNLTKNIREERYKREIERDEYWAKIFGRFFMVIEAFSVLILLPLIVVYFIAQISFSEWLGRLIYFVARIDLFVFELQIY